MLNTNSQTVVQRIKTAWLKFLVNRARATKINKLPDFILVFPINRLKETKYLLMQNVSRLRFVLVEESTEQEPSHFYVGVPGIIEQHGEPKFTPYTIVKLKFTAPTILDTVFERIYKPYGDFDYVDTLNNIPPHIVAQLISGSETWNIYPPSES